jgi:hypothetical protein
MKTNNKYLFLIGFASLLLISCQKEDDIDSPTPEPNKFKFSANYIAAISDADMLATAYVTDQLGEKQPLNAEDSLSIFLSPFNLLQRPVAKLTVSNSVTGAVAAIDKSDDGKFVYIIENNKPVNFNDATTLSGLGLGTRLTVLNMSNPTSPTVSSTSDNFLFPLSVSINKAGNMLAINELKPQAGGQISLIPVNNGALGEKVSFTFASLGVPVDPQVPAQRGRGLLSNYAQWHPSGEYIAVNFQDRGNLQGQGEVRFFKVNKSENVITGLTPHGSEQITGKFPFSGRWSPNGKYYMTNDVYWGFDVPQFFITERQSTITVIEFDSSNTAKHKVIGKTETGTISEGIAINKEGTFMATANMRGSSLLPTAPLFTRASSVSLLKFNQNTGILTKVSELEIDGAILPEGIAFDNLSENIVITTFDNFMKENTNRLGKGSLDFIHISNSKVQPTLQFQGRIFTGRGIHGLVIH